MKSRNSRCSRRQCIGTRDFEAGSASVRVHGKVNVGAKAKAEVNADILASIKLRRAQWRIGASRTEPEMQTPQPFPGAHVRFVLR